MRDDALISEDGDPRIDHIGIAVESIERSLKLYQADLACEAEAPVELPQEQVRAVLIRLGESRIELLKRNADSLSRSLSPSAEGIHHLAIKVTDLDASLARLRASGRRLVTDSVRGGEGRYRYIFIHPKSAGGVLLELIEE
jgi:methylmalonyl-CoA epimerase